MTMLGWSALGNLSVKVLAHSSSLTEILSYTNMAIAVCGAVTALIVLAGSRHREDAGETEAANDDPAEQLRALTNRLRSYPRSTVRRDGQKAGAPAG